MSIAHDNESEAIADAAVERMYEGMDAREDEQRSAQPKDGSCTPKDGFARSKWAAFHPELGREDHDHE